jgi:hypothetical protein
MFLSEQRQEAVMPTKKNTHLKYGEGQREQYGEGTAYRPEDKTKAAQESDEHGFAGGERKDKSLPHPRKPADECK